jgi:hypothetical protein
VGGVIYEGVSKSPRTMLITRKPLVVHEFPARVRCGGFLWVCVLSGVVGCGSVWLLHVSLCVYCISCLRFSDIGGMAEVEQGVHQVLCENGYNGSTIHHICVEFGMCYGSCQQILTEQLNMHRIAAQFVPRELTQDQKESQVAICQELKETEKRSHSPWTSSQAMKASFILTTQRQNRYLRNGRVLGLLDPKKQIEQDARLFFDQDGIVH